MFKQIGAVARQARDGPDHEAGASRRRAGRGTAASKQVVQRAGCVFQRGKIRRYRAERVALGLIPGLYRGVPRRPGDTRPAKLFRLCRERVGVAVKTPEG
jgi:hypothetical protein